MGELLISEDSLGNRVQDGQGRQSRDRHLVAVVKGYWRRAQNRQGWEGRNQGQIPITQPCVIVPSHFRIASLLQTTFSSSICSSFLLPNPSLLIPQRKKAELVCSSKGGMRSICLRNHPACGDSKNIYFYEVITCLANENTSGGAYKMPHWQGRFIQCIPSTASLTLIKSSSKINIIEFHSSARSEKPAQVESPAANLLWCPLRKGFLPRWNLCPLCFISIAATSDCPIPWAGFMP